MKNNSVYLPKVSIPFAFSMLFRLNIHERPNVKISILYYILKVKLMTAFWETIAYCFFKIIYSMFKILQGRENKSSRRGQRILDHTLQTYKKKTKKKTTVPPLRKLGDCVLYP